MTTEPQPTARFRLVSLLLPAALTLAALAIQLALVESVPDPVAIHWSTSAVPDGFAPAWSLLVVTMLFGYGIPALIGLAMLPGLRAGDRGPTYRFLGAGALGISMMVVGLATGTLWLQRGLPEAQAAPPLTGVVATVSALALLAGVLGWLLQPAQSPPAPRRREGQELELGEGENVAWIRTVTPGRVPLGVFAAALVAVLVGVVVTWALPTDPVTPWILTGTLVLLLVMTALMAGFRVRAGREGLVVTSLLGLPRFRVPIADIDDVAIVGVNPTSEFGGWGLRHAPGRFGVIMRTGSALQVTRHNGRQFVVTIDDAPTAAAVLNAYRRRAGART